MFNIHQHWDPLQTCIVGRTVPPEYYSWIKKPRLRSLFERMSIETESGSQLLVKKLQDLGVQVVRPNVNFQHPSHEKNVFVPPLQPRNTMMMIGNKFYYQNWSNQYWKKYYANIADASWGNYDSVHDFLAHATAAQINEAYDQFNLAEEMCFFTHFNDTYSSIIDFVKQQGNQTIDWEMSDGGLLTRIGQDLYFGTSEEDRDMVKRQTIYDSEFSNYRNHMIDSIGHTDGIFCAVCPGLIIAHDDPNLVIDYNKYFPGWEVIYVRNNSPMAFKETEYKEFFKKTQFRWWMPGHENDHELIDLVENSFDSWIGSSGESVFDVNMLVVDAKNVITIVKNDQLNTILEKHGITVHVLDMPQMYFWDGGVHCMTTDLDRIGKKQNYFPDRI
jgi:hypothetical protein